MNEEGALHVVHDGIAAPDAPRSARRRPFVDKLPIHTDRIALQISELG